MPYDHGASFCYLVQNFTHPLSVSLSLSLSHQGAARRSTAQKKVVEVESVGVSGKSDSNRVAKYFQLEVKIFKDFSEKKNGCILF